MKPLIIFFLICISFISMISFVNATCQGDTNYNTWTIPQTTTKVCLWYDYDEAHACCIHDTCTTINDFNFCYDDQTSYCVKGQYLKCCGGDYPNYDPVTGWCWSKTWQCYQGFNNDCSKYGPNAWCVGLVCKQPVCTSSGGCSVGQMCDTSNSNAQKWKCVADPCYNVQCPDTCSNDMWMTGGSCKSGGCTYSATNWVQGKCGAECGSNSDCGTPNPDTACQGFNYMTGNNCQRGKCILVPNTIIGKCGVECTRPSDCGTDTYEGKFCSSLDVGGNVMQNYRTYSCNGNKCSSSVTAKLISKCDWKCDNSTFTCRQRNILGYFVYDSTTNSCKSIDLDQDNPPNATDLVYADCKAKILPTYYRYADEKCTKILISNSNAGQYDFTTLEECQTYLPKSIPPNSSNEPIKIPFFTKTTTTNVSNGTGITGNAIITQSETSVNWVAVIIAILVVLVVAFFILKKLRYL